MKFLDDKCFNEFSFENVTKRNPVQELEQGIQCRTNLNKQN